MTFRFALATPLGEHVGDFQVLNDKQLSKVHMRRATDISRRIGQRLIAVVLLVASLLLPIAPLLNASQGSLAEACRCCRRKDHRDCHMSHTEAFGGQARVGSANCRSGCQQPGDFGAPASSLVPDNAGVAYPPDPLGGLGFSTDSYRAVLSYSAWRYQRPPPLT
jgi:hypothetical protein